MHIYVFIYLFIYLTLAQGPYNSEQNKE